MEIEDLKDIWRKQSEGFKRKDETEFATMLKGKSRSIISRLKRNVWFELIFTFLGGLALLTYAFTIPAGALKWTSISIPVLFAIYSFYYVKKLRLLNEFSTGNEDIKANLERLTASLTSYLKFYRRSYSILYPVYIFLLLLFTAIEQGMTGFLDKITKPEIFIPLLLAAGVFFICSTWLTSWYLRKLYGNHLDKLKGILRELESVDSLQ